jgi:hypothetical protein
MNSGLYSILKIGALTFAGAFFGALSLAGGLPTTLHGVVGLLAPALGAAIAAEVYYLRTQIAALLAGATAAPGAPTTTTTTTTSPAPQLAAVPPPPPKAAS